MFSRIITTSPIPSNPDPELILRSFLNIPSPHTFIVFDGYTIAQNKEEYKLSKISSESVEAYEKLFAKIIHFVFNFKQEMPQTLSMEFEDFLPEEILNECIMIESIDLESLNPISKPFRVKSNLNSNLLIINHGNTTIIKHSIRVGFALAVKSALELITTPMVVIQQHDWVLNGYIPFDDLVLTCKDYDVNYIGFISRRSVKYHSNNFPELLKNFKDPLMTINGLPFTKLYFWYDRVHIAKVSYYLNTVFNNGTFKKGDFIEDILGTSMVQELKKEPEAWNNYKAVLYYPDSGKIVQAKHLNGRKFKNYLKYDIPDPSVDKLSNKEEIDDYEYYLSPDQI